MSYLISVIAFVFIFSLLILIHEFGHFYAARKAGVKVEEFGMGLPPRALTLSKDKLGTIYSLNWIPFGGFVRMFGEDSSDPKMSSKDGSFGSKSIAARIIIVLGGVFMNFLLGFVVLVYLLKVGAGPFILNGEDLKFYRDSGAITALDTVQISAFSADSLADDNGLKSGDLILQVNGTEIVNSKQLVEYVSSRPGQTAQFTVKRVEEEMNFSIPIGADGKLGIEIRDYPLIQNVQPFTIGESLKIAAQDTVRLSWYTMKMFVMVIIRMITQAEISDQVSGPVGIFQLTHVATQNGINDVLKLIVILSISLGAVNVLPIPALDGGRFLTLAFEAITRRKPNPAWEARIHALGFVILITLIFLITYKDIVRLLS